MTSTARATGFDVSVEWGTPTRAQDKQQTAGHMARPSPAALGATTDPASAKRRSREGGVVVEAIDGCGLAPTADLLEQLHEARAELADRVILGDATPKDLRRMRYIDWQIDSVEAAELAPSLDRLRDLAAMQRKAADVVGTLVRNLQGKRTR